MSTPDRDACLPWLRAEIEAVSPAMVVALGATASSPLVEDLRAASGTASG